MMVRPLVVYFSTVKVYGHTRRIYVASRTKKKVHDIFGMGAAGITDGNNGQVASGTEKIKDAWTPTFIDQDSEESVWLEKRDHDEEGYLYADKLVNYGVNGGGNKATRRPTDPEAWIHCATMADCQEALTTTIIDNALKARGIPREDL
jgi:hypothetical protein